MNVKGRRPRLGAAQARDDSNKQLAVALSDELRTMLDRAAEQNGHSLGEEVRRRLWFSFAEMADTGNRNVPDYDRYRYQQAWLDQPTEQARG